ncbi:hypothetical protein RchiOBHm_Chr3g0469961 [Rosa chinensis]|uniref:Uncharacterized protein n=1 Tax=Rosa chinensis TaxID=74649 RepID=A0A2P6RAY3_ROSCH|nr:hypothetical protein RchiOBHm_Chr3g0469961 [Rosa chinensis]
MIRSVEAPLLSAGSMAGEHFLPRCLGYGCFFASSRTRYISDFGKCMSFSSFSSTSCLFLQFPSTATSQKISPFYYPEIYWCAISRRCK